MSGPLLYRQPAVLKFILFLTVALFAGCADGRGEGATEEPARLSLEVENFIGQWNRQAEFDGRNVPLWIDSTFTFDSVGDTLFRYSYRISGDMLVFEDAYGTVTPVQVLRLTSDSLVLTGLPFTDGALRFYRGSSP